MTEEEQILSVKEMGMMFEYMRQPTVWHAFCATYEGIYDKMIEFDTWYAKNEGVATFSLHEEWKSYMRVVIDSAANTTQVELTVQFPLSLYAEGPTGIYNLYNDFSRTNLAWLREEEDTAPKDSVRMKKLMEKAQAEKSRVEILEEDSEIGQRMDMQPAGDAIDPALLSGGDGEVPTAMMFGDPTISNLPSTMNRDTNPAFISPADLMKNPDTIYPDPQGIPREHMMGIGYYQQRNDADKILFDAPNASADNEHQDAPRPTARMASQTDQFKAAKQEMQRAFEKAEEEEKR
ncbi:hypothetical protein ACLOAV_009845 [Pseudogymnoascus australis]